MLRAGAALTGVVLTLSAALAADLARGHMLALGAICGTGANPHCGWCLGGAGLALAGVVAFAFALGGPQIFPVSWRGLDPAQGGDSRTP